jgi:hypothetical protein
MIMPASGPEQVMGCGGHRQSTQASHNAKMDGKNEKVLLMFVNAQPSFPSICFCEQEKKE